MIEKRLQKMLGVLIALTLLLGFIAPMAEVVGEEKCEYIRADDTDMSETNPTSVRDDEHTRYITEEEYINNTERKEDNNIIIKSDGHLKINNSTLVLMMDEESHMWNITVKDGGELSLWNSTIKTNPDPTLLRPFLKTDVTITGDSRLSLRKGSAFTFPGFVNIDGSELEMINSTFEALEDVPEYDYLWGEGDLESEAIDDNDDGPRLIVVNESEVFMEDSEINDYYTFDSDEDLWEMTWYPLDEEGNPIEELQTNGNNEYYELDDDELEIDRWFLSNPFVPHEELGDYPHINPIDRISSLYVEIEYQTEENYRGDGELSYYSPEEEEEIDVISIDESEGTNEIGANIWERDLSRFTREEVNDVTRLLKDLYVRVTEPSDEYNSSIEIETLRLVSSYDNDIHVRDSDFTVINSFIDVDLEESDVDPRTDSEEKTNGETYLPNSNVDHRVLRVYNSSFRSYGLSIEREMNGPPLYGDPWILNTETSHNETWIYRWVDLQITNQDDVPLPGATVNPRPDNRIDRIDEILEEINDPENNRRAWDYMKETGNGSYAFDISEPAYVADDEGRVTMFLASDRINYPKDWPNSEYVGNYELELAYEDEEQGIKGNATVEMSLEHFPKMDNPEQINGQIPIDLPDLQAGELKMEEEDQPIYPEKEIKLSMDVLNVGDVDAHNFTVAFYEGEFDPENPSENRFDFTELDQLNESENKEVKATWQAPEETGSYLLTGVVDPENNVTEKDRDNNEANITVDVVNEPFFEIYIESPEDGDTFVEDERVRIDYTVENLGGASDTQNIVFWVDDEHVDTEENVTLESNRTHTGEFDWTAVPPYEDRELTVESDDYQDEVTITVLEDRFFQVNIDSPVEGEEFGEDHDVTIEYTVENTGEAEDTQDIEFYVDDELIGIEEGVELDGDETYSHHLDWIAEAPYGERSVVVESDDDQDEVTITVLEDSFFQVNIDSLEYEDEFVEDQTVTVEYTVENTGEAEDTQDIELYVDDELIGIEEGVELDGDETYSHHLDWIAEAPYGERSVVVESDDDQDEVTITVLEDSFFQVNIDSPVEGEDLIEGETVTVEYTVENLGDVEDTQDVEFWVDDEHVDTEENITLDGAYSGEFNWITGESSREYDLIVESEDHSHTVTITVLERPFFYIGITSPEEGEWFREGDEISVEYNMTNTGEGEDTQDVEFWVDDEHVDTEIDVTLASDETHSGNFTWRPPEIDAEEKSYENRTLSIRVEGYPEESRDETQITIELVRDLEFINVSWLRNNEEIDTEDGFELDEMDTLTFEAQIENVGTRVIEEATFEYSFPDGTEGREEFNILVGEKENVSVEWTANVVEEEEIIIRVNSTEEDTIITYSEIILNDFTIEPLEDVVVRPISMPENLRPGEEGITFDGTVETEDGDPWEGIEVAVSIIGEDEEVISTTTDTTEDDGYFLVSLQMPEDSGDYEIEYEAQTHHRQSARQDITVESERLEIGGLPWWLFVVVIVAAAAGGIGSLIAYFKFFSRQEVVECGNCGTSISADSTTCPSCGVEFDMSTVKCSECGEWIPASSDDCPECGAEFIKTGEEVEDYAERMKKQYDKFVMKQKEEAEERLDQELSKEEFLRWWEQQPSFVTFDDWLERKEEQRKKGGQECPNCGTLNSVDDGVCQKCGASLIELEIMEEKSTSRREEMEEEEEEEEMFSEEEEVETSSEEDEEETSSEEDEEEDEIEGEEKTKKKSVKKKPKKKVKKKVVKDNDED